MPRRDFVSSLSWNGAILAVLVLCLTAMPVAGKPESGGARPVLVGGTLSLTGRYSAMGRMQEKGYRLWEKEINRKGGLLGRPVKVLILDDESSPEKVTAVYTDLLRRRKVDIAISPYSSELTLRAADQAERYRYPMLAAGASSGKIWETPRRYTFGVYSTADRYFIGFLELCALHNIRNVAIVGFGDPFSLYSAEGAKVWAEKFGLNVIRYEILMEAGEDSLRAEAGRIAAVRPDAVVAAGHFNETCAIRAALGGAGANVRAFAGSVGPALPEFRERMGPLADGVFGASQWEPDERIPYPGNTAFVEEFRKTFGEEPSYHAASAYAAMQLQSAAVQETRSINRERIREYLAAGEHRTIMGSFKIRHDGTQIGHRSVIIQWQKGRKEIVWPEKMRTSPPVFP